MKVTKIHIDGLPFQVYENLGSKSLVPPSSFDALGTLIEELKKDYGEEIKNKLKNGKLFSNDGISVTIVEEEKINEALRFWKRNTNQEASGEMFLISTPHMPSYAFIPRSTLLKIVEKLDDLLFSESQIPSPPWLFRETPIAKYACNKEPYKNVEENMIKSLEEKFQQYDIGANGEIFPKGTLNPLPEDHEFLKGLKSHGLFSATYQEIKKDYLLRWGSIKLIAFYQKQLDKQEQQSYLINKSLNIQVKRFFDELSKPVSDQDKNVISELRKELGAKLNKLGYLDKLKNKDKREQLLSTTASLSDLNQYLKGVGFLWQYVESAERRNKIGKDKKEVLELINFPVILEWFLLQKPPKGYTPFDWLALCEKELYTVSLDQPKQLFKKIGKGTVVLYIDNVDSTVCKLVTYELKMKKNY